METFEPSKDTILQSIEDTTLAPSFQQLIKKRWRLWGGTLLVLLLFGLQFAAFNIDTLGQNPSYRPFYQVACRVLGCHLPSLIDLERIKTTHLVLNQHPDTNKALIIDAILVNEAPFPSSLPLATARIQ